eukprot:UN12191
MHSTSKTSGENHFAEFSNRTCMMLLLQLFEGR